MVCLDTSVIVPLLRKDKKALANLNRAIEDGVRVSTTVVSLCELYGGAYGAASPTKELERIEKLTSTLEIFELTAEASRKFGELLNSNPIKAQPIGDFDLMIAAIVLTNSEALATRNPDHFGRVSDLKVEGW